MRQRDDHDLTRDVFGGLIASAVWIPISGVINSQVGRPAAFAASVVAIFVVTFVLLRVSLSRRRLRRLTIRFSSEPSATKAGDLVLDIIDELMDARRLEPDLLAELAQRRRHPASRILDDVDLVLGSTPPSDAAYERLSRYLDTVRVSKRESAATAALRASRQLGSMLGDNAVLLLYGYSTIVCEAVRMAAPTVPVFVVRDAQYGHSDSLNEHAIVRRLLADKGIDSYLIESDQITSLLDPAVHRLRLGDGASIPLPHDREMVAVIGCEAADRSGRVLIPAIVRTQPSETAWFVGEFAQARQQGQGAALSAQLVVVSQSYKVFDDLESRPELRTTAAPISVPWWRRLAHALTGMELPYGAAVDLVEIGPSYVDMYIDDVAVTSTVRGSLQLDASCDVWSQRVGIAQTPTIVTRQDLSGLLVDCELVFVDFNGVLVDDEVDHYCAFTAVCRSTADRSLPIDVYLGACAGRTDVEGIEELLRLGFVEGPQDQLLREKQRSFHDHAVPVGDSHRERIRIVLNKMGSVASLVLVTASDHAAVVSTLGDPSILEDYFVGDRALFETPSTQRASIVDRAARRWGVTENRRCLVIDDSARNLAEARRRGYRTLGVSGLVSDRALPADVVVRDLVELSNLLEVPRSTE